MFKQSFGNETSRHRACLRRHQQAFVKMMTILTNRNKYKLLQMLDEAEHQQSQASRFQGEGSRNPRSWKSKSSSSSKFLDHIIQIFSTGVPFSKSKSKILKIILNTSLSIWNISILLILGTGGEWKKRSQQSDQHERSGSLGWAFDDDDDYSDGKSWFNDSITTMVC